MYTPDQVARAVEAHYGEDTWHNAESWLPAGVSKSDWREVDVDKDNRLLLDIDGQAEYAEYMGGKPAEEGGGERIHVVIKVGQQYFMKHGCHISHDGTYWDGSVNEVRPETKTITVYETL